MVAKALVTLFIFLVDYDGLRACFEKQLFVFSGSVKKWCDETFVSNVSWGFAVSFVVWKSILYFSISSSPS